MAVSKVRYNRTLVGENAEIIVAKAIGYTAQPNYQAFELNAADGELGIFDALSGRAIFAGGGSIPTPPSAPVLVASTTGGTLAAATYYLVYSYLNASGESVQSAEASVTTTGSTSSIAVSFPVGPFGTTSRVYYGTSAAGEGHYSAVASGIGTLAYTGQTGTVGTPLSSATGVVANVLADKQQYFVALRRDNDGITAQHYVKRSTTITYDAARTRKVPYVAPVKQVTTINISAGYVPVTRDDLEVAIIETTPGNEPFPVWDYDAVIGDTNVITTGGASVPVLTLAQALQRIVYRINNPLDLVHKDDGQPCTATYTDNGGGVYTLVITANYFEEHFRIALRGPLATYAAVTYTTGFVAGSGYSDQVSRLEAQGWIFEGVTTNYPMNGNPADYGTPASYVVASLTYNIYHMDPLRTSAEPNPLNIRQHYAHIQLITPVQVGGSAATSPDVIVGAVLGF